MVFTVRCYKCGADAVRLVLGGRSILHARCHSCGCNLLAEVLQFEDEIDSQELNELEPPMSEATSPELIETGAE